MRAMIFVLLIGCTDSGSVDSGAPPTCDGGNCSCTGSSCTCPSGAGCEFQCSGPCKVTCTGPCVVHCVTGNCAVKCPSDPTMCAHGDLTCNRNCPP